MFKSLIMDRTKLDRELSWNDGFDRWLNEFRAGTKCGLRRHAVLPDSTADYFGVRNPTPVFALVQAEKTPD